MDASPDTKTVIVVDDEVNIVDLLVDIMTSAGYRAIGCSVWTEAMNAINRESPDLVLLDLKMPTIDGPSMLEFIRSEGLDVPVIVVSGFVTDQVTEDLSKLGVSAFVNKPFRAAEILKQVESVLADAEPASMSVLYESTDTESKPSEPQLDAPQTNEVLAALKKLDGDTSEPAAQAPQPPAPEPPSTEPANEVLAALQKNEPTAPPAPAPPPAQSSPPPKPPPAPKLPTAPSTAPTGPPEDTAINGLSRTPEDEDTAGRSVSVTGHRRHHRPPVRRKRFTKRNFILFGSMFVICLAVAGFMAAMNWYAAQIDVEEIRKNTEKAITDQATKEILQQLKDSR